MLLAKLGQWTGPQTGSGAIAYKISDNITKHASSIVQMLEEEMQRAATPLYQMFRHRNCRVIP